MDAQVARVVSVIGAPGDEGRRAAALFCSLLQNDTDLCEKFPSSSPLPRSAPSTLFSSPLCSSFFLLPGFALREEVATLAPLQVLSLN